MKHSLGFHVILAVSVLSSISVIAGDQIPPLSTDGSDCTINDPKSLLLRSAYSNQKYELKTKEKSPLTLLENLSPENGITLQIEQRGCSDTYVRISVVFSKPVLLEKPDVKVSRAVQLIKSLKLNPDNAAFFSLDLRNKIANLIEDEAKLNKNTPFRSKKTVCLNNMNYSDGKSECISDVSFQLTDSEFSAFYVDRP